ncbi:hypothetical protein COR50_03400 [Chitinophaga caeni]|uniref:Glycosyl transferase family 1 domain-containing protein n=1 Tax=Chitinophaga caeni TaxID=2029983 RepID=A0A291QQX0_9BACT|nr:glycosyltransferase [Chitinophaga caeni]ATL46293.1 hypothetical protein COR50_03400 [Chitinophaga caeni]
MRIAVIAPHIAEDHIADTGLASTLLLQSLAGQNPANDWNILTDASFQFAAPMPSNLRQSLVKGNTGSGLGRLLQQSLHWPNAMKQYQPDILFCIDFIYPIKAGRKAYLALMYFPGILQSEKAKKHLPLYEGIIVFSGYMKQQVLQAFPAMEGKVTVVAPGVPAGLAPLDWDERQALKQKYANAAEYFVVVSSIHPKNNIIPLLKAFSAFKKRMRSSMKLVIVGSVSAAGAEIMESLKTYRFRDEVKCLQDVTAAELSKIIAGAYAMVHVAGNDGMALPVYIAAATEVPLVVTNGSAAAEIGKNGALRVVPGDINDLAEKIGAIYKDEHLRAKILQQLPTGNNFPSWRDAANNILETLQEG